MRKYLTIFLIFFTMFILTFYTFSNINGFQDSISITYFQADIKKYLIYTSKCRIPEDSPFNEDIKEFFHRVEYISCSEKELLTYTKRNESVVTLHINESLLPPYSANDISCCYSAVLRVSDDKVRFSECTPFKKSVIITSDIVLVKCKTSLNNNYIYSNVHAVFTPKHISAEKMKYINTEGDSFSVLLIGIDSISKMNLIRTMPKTHKFLEEHDFLNLRGYTKIGDNTFPNLGAILTGKTKQQIYNHCDPAKNKLNNCDIIWDKFCKLGYITAYGEDESPISTFNYNRQGFSTPPTDFYFRPYFIAAEKLPSMKRFGMHYCSGPENSGERIMNLVIDFTTTFQHHPKFGLFWMNTFSHDDLNLPSSMDEKVKYFLETLYQGLENTIVFFFSDHGFRFGDIRYTHTGWLEERLPFIYIHLPESFKRKYNKEYKNFIINTRRLSNPFDIYMTLQHILYLANSNHSIQPSLGCPKCQSLFKEIDEARSCKDGAIEQHWCMCTGHSYIDPNKKIVQKTAEFIVSELNTLIKSSKDGYKCAYYNLKKIVSSGMSDSYLNDRNQSVNYFLLLIETKPRAMFEATIEVEQKSRHQSVFRLLGDISRTNRYDINTECINSDLKKYCYCD